MKPEGVAAPSLIHPATTNRSVSMEKVKVVIAVNGGNVSQVCAASFVEVEIVDFDNMKAEGLSDAECEARWIAAVGDTPSQW
jgi:hypothetical protein